jgi:hypothetical protein
VNATVFITFEQPGHLPITQATVVAETSAITSACSAKNAHHLKHFIPAQYGILNGVPTETR